MRRMIPNKLIDWVKSLFERVVYNPTGNKVEIGTNAEVDGDLDVNGDIDVATGGKLGHSIAQSDFLENLHSSLTISNFSAYQMGQFVYVELKVTGTNYSAYTKIFDIKEAFKPKTAIYSTINDTSNWNGSCYCFTDGVVKNAQSTTSDSCYCNLRFIYEIA